APQPREQGFSPFVVVRPRLSPYHNGGPQVVQSQGRTSDPSIDPEEFARSQDMAAPWDYASSVYLNLKATLDDGTLVTLKIDRYLNNGLKLKRNQDADKAKDSLLSRIAGELKV